MNFSVERSRPLTGTMAWKDLPVLAKPKRYDLRRYRGLALLCTIVVALLVWLAL